MASYFSEEYIDALERNNVKAALQYCVKLPVKQGLSELTRYDMENPDSYFSMSYLQQSWIKAACEGP